jgi:S-adenosylmethionine synthetase|tara:strand:- start:41154 stop:42365 length:1212 start_codon:yes stop_codon:yes gene_type:complete
MYQPIKICKYDMAQSYIFSSESVTEGHPDKVCDTISDSIVDACFEQDPNSRVACETMVKDNIVALGGEVTTKAEFDYQSVVKAAIEDIGYVNNDCKFNANNFFFLNALGKQSSDIAQGVDAAAADDKQTEEQGAGDQGIMFGYAVKETPELMPAPIAYSHKLGRAVTELRKSGKHDWLRPDNKTQVSIEYVDGKPSRITAVVVSVQHAADITTQEIRDILKKDLVEAELPTELLTEDTEYHINPTGLFIIGGPEGDCGLTGRKIIVDTYGGMGRHGGGAFSGKDPSKVDRSAAYMARYVAKNVVAAGLADRCELQLAYAIGYPDPVSVHVDTFGTNQIEEAKIVNGIQEVFSFKPANFISQLNLLRPIYRKTTNYGHFGREDDLDAITWEKTDKVDDLKNACS